MDDCCFAAGCAQGSRGSGGFLRGRGRAAPVREGSVLTLCLGTLNTVISDSEGLWPNQSLCYWTSASDYSSQTFDIGRCQMVPAFFFVSPLSITLGRSSRNFAMATFFLP